jgi:hypothetical protein
MMSEVPYWRMQPVWSAVAEKRTQAPAPRFSSIFLPYEPCQHVAPGRMPAQAKAPVKKAPVSKAPVAPKMPQEPKRSWTA